MQLRLLTAVLGAGMLSVSALAGAAEPQQAFPDAEVRANQPVVLKIRPPAGFKINAAAPNRVMLQEGDSGRIVHVWQSGTIRSLEIFIGKRPASDEPWILQGTLFTCQKTNAKICLTQKVRQQFRVTLAAKSSMLEWRLREPPTMESPSPGASSVR
jgi:hypothetical protein